jgi:hypothetical protein
MNMNSGGFFIPSFEEGLSRRIKQRSRYQKLGATGRAAQERQRAASREVKQLSNASRCLTSPRCAVSKVAFHFLERRIVPSSKEGIKIHHYSGSSPNHQPSATSPTKAGIWEFEQISKVWLNEY